LPTPAGPSTRSGRSSAEGEPTHERQLVVSEVTGPRQVAAQIGLLLAMVDQDSELTGRGQDGKDDLVCCPGCRTLKFARDVRAEAPLTAQGA